MKKFVSLLVVAIMMFAFAASAMAATGTASYADGTITYSGADVNGILEIYYNGDMSDSFDAATGAFSNRTKTRTAVEGDFLLYADENGETRVPINFPAEPTVAPATEAPATEAPATEEPTVTEAPATTDAPEATKAPAKKDNKKNDVPKTGENATGIYVVVALMAVAAVVLSARKIIRSR
jgi:hypothetical protein